MLRYTRRNAAGKSPWIQRAPYFRLGLEPAGNLRIGLLLAGNALSFITAGSLNVLRTRHRIGIVRPLDDHLAWRLRGDLRCWWFSLLLPVGTARFFHSFTFNTRFVAGLALLAMAVVQPPPQLKKLRPNWVDLLVAVYVGAMSISVYLGGDFVPLGALDDIRIWVFPYLLGRIAGTAMDRLEKVLPFLVGLCVLISLGSVFEAVTRVNLVSELTGRWSFAEIRWGLRRASGNAVHPIAFGLMLTLMSPIAFEAYQRAKQAAGQIGGGTCPRSWPPRSSAPCRAGRRWFCFVAWGMPSFGSRRGDSNCWPGWSLEAPACITQDFAKSALQSAEGRHSYRGKVLINGKTYDYSSGLHRELLFIVYGQSMLHAGWFGYGNKDMSEIPFQATVMGADFWSVDDHYILCILQKGWLGIVLFLLVGSVGMYQLVRVALDLDAPGAPLAAAAGSSIGAVMIILITVFFNSVSSDVWMFWIGLGTSWRRCKPVGGPAVVIGRAGLRIVAAGSFPGTRCRPQIRRRRNRHPRLRRCPRPVPRGPSRLAINRPYPPNWARDDGFLARRVGASRFSN